MGSSNPCAAAYQARGCKPIKSASARKNCEKDASDERKECEKAQWTSLSTNEDEKAAVRRALRALQAAAMERKEDEQAEYTSNLLRIGVKNCYGGVWYNGVCSTATVKVPLTSVLRN